jgi:hypothetical protein
VIVHAAFAWDAAKAAKTQSTVVKRPNSLNIMSSNLPKEVVSVSKIVDGNTTKRSPSAVVPAITPLPL